jgi:hypothetical protein
MADTVQPALDEDKCTIADEANGENGKEVNTIGADAALRYAADERIAIDDETNRRLLRSTDLHILPWLCALYFMQYLDKGM